MQKHKVIYNAKHIKHIKANISGHLIITFLKQLGLFQSPNSRILHQLKASAQRFWLERFLESGQLTKATIHLLSLLLAYYYNSCPFLHLHLHC